MNNKESVTGLFFGSFNPIHNGHVAIARYLLDLRLCREVWFIISPCNPFKVDRFLLPEHDRYKIVETAIAGVTGMKACNVEFSMPKPSYTVDTLRVLSNLYPDQKFALIIGADNALMFSQWKDYLWIKEHFPIFVYPREGVSITHEKCDGMTLIDAPLFPLSATEIRDMICHGGDISGLVPPKALSLIQNLYSK